MSCMTVWGTISPSIALADNLLLYFTILELYLSRIFLIFFIILWKSDLYCLFLPTRGHLCQFFMYNHKSASHYLFILLVILVTHMLFTDYPSEQKKPKKVPYTDLRRFSSGESSLYSTTHSMATWRQPKEPVASGGRCGWNKALHVLDMILLSENI